MGQGASVNVHNDTLEDIVIIDCYDCRKKSKVNSKRSSGLNGVTQELGWRDGVTEYRIPAGEKKDISSSIYKQRLMKMRKTQEIHVRVSGKTMLVLFYDKFENNKEIIFKMPDGPDGSIIPIYHAKTETTLDDRKWYKFGSSGSRFNTESAAQYLPRCNTESAATLPV